MPKTESVSALHYMEKQLRRHLRNFERESKRGVPTEMLDAILRKASYYDAAVEALRKESGDE